MTGSQQGSQGWSKWAGNGVYIPAYRDSSPGTHPDLGSPAYRSTALRHPLHRLDSMPQTPTELSGPRFSYRDVRDGDDDLTRQHDDAPQGERIIVHGRVLDDEARPIAGTLVEIWQANAAGRYRHSGDRHPAPLDPNFTGVGRCVTDEQGRYRFTTIKPGSYPWGNHLNAWRPAHVHFSLVGRAFVQRIVSQMYFPGDPLLNYDPIYQAVRDESARQRMVSRFDLDATVPDWALAYQWDIVLRGRSATPIEGDGGGRQ